jgi:branched-chain amino acid transport system ATP-binding protein
MADVLLRIRGLAAGYRRMPVLHEVSLTIVAGESVGLVGANGAGKTTLLRAISGVVRSWAGTIEFDGADIGRWPAERISRHGLAHVPQDRHVFPDLTVAENLSVGATPGLRNGLSRTEASARAAYWLDRFPLLAKRAGQPAGVLSGGEQQMLVICRALMAGPKLLLLDEPTLGLAPLAQQQCFELLAELQRDGLTTLVVDQDADRLWSVVHRLYRLEYGEVTEVPASETRRNESSAVAGSAIDSDNRRL